MKRLPLGRVCICEEGVVVKEVSMKRCMLVKKMSS